jgi:hypothetical protein
MDVNTKLKLCVIANFVLLIILTTLLSIFNTQKGKYCKFGPSDDLILIGVEINSWSRYIVLLLFITFMKSTKCVIDEIAHPIIGFNIYNPDKKVIKDFTKIELQIYGNSMYLIDNIRKVFMIMLAISQIDIALWSVVVSEITSIFTIRMLLNEKKFTKDETELEMDLLV